MKRNILIVAIIVVVITLGIGGYFLLFNPAEKEFITVKSFDEKSSLTLEFKDYEDIYYYKLDGSVTFEVEDVEWFVENIIKKHKNYIRTFTRKNINYENGEAKDYMFLKDGYYYVMNRSKNTKRFSISVPVDSVEIIQYPCFTYMGKKIITWDKVEEINNKEDVLEFYKNMKEEHALVDEENEIIKVIGFERGAPHEPTKITNRYVIELSFVEEGVKVDCIVTSEELQESWIEIN